MSKKKTRKPKVFLVSFKVTDNCGDSDCKRVTRAHIKEVIGQQIRANDQALKVTAVRIEVEGNNR